MPDAGSTGGGRLLVTATPIGNLGDLSPRAADALATAEVIACEDTRRTGRLLELSGIERRGRLLRVDAHTEGRAVAAILEALAEGNDVVLVSDAGTPGVSDPGSQVVAAAVAAGHAVVAVPGPSAVLAALVVSGLPTHRFTMEGFPARGGRSRERLLTEVAGAERTTVLFESPHRVAALLEDLAAACGPERRVAVCRELTKLHETTWRGPVGSAAAAIGDARGEYVVVVGPAAPRRAPTDDEIRDRVARHRAEGQSRRDAVRITAEELGVPKNRVYDLCARPEGDGSPSGGQR